MPIAAVSNVAVFKGGQICQPSINVIFHASPGDIISTEAKAAEIELLYAVIDGTGCTLLPALIDSNIDTAAADRDLQMFASFVIAVVLDMSSTTAEIQAMRAVADTELGLPSYLAAGTIARSEIEDEGQLYPPRETGIVSLMHEAEAFVTSQIYGPNKSDYIKALVDLPGISVEILAALVQAAHGHGKLAVAYCTQTIGYSRALQGGFDIITSIPIDGIINQEVCDGLAAAGVACIPTLCMARAMVDLVVRRAEGRPVDVHFDHALANVKKLYKAGVRICAGTEANSSSVIPIAIGSSLHDELELLVQAGLSNFDALRSATIVPATVFGLVGRGELQAGRRADMILVEGDPLLDITATKKIRKVWISGVEVAGWNNSRLVTGL